MTNNEELIRQAEDDKYVYCYEPKYSDEVARYKKGSRRISVFHDYIAYEKSPFNV
tara:strand:- start:368 stop:532 length:165 start_codon:yes stop_codon:yes gene_type:complete